MAACHYSWRWMCIVTRRLWLWQVFKRPITLVIDHGLCGVEFVFHSMSSEDAKLQQLLLREMPDGVIWWNLWLIYGGQNFESTLSYAYPWPKNLRFPQQHGPIALLWDHGIDRLICTYWFHCFCIQVCNCLTYALSWRPSPHMVLHRRKSCYANPVCIPCW